VVLEAASLIVVGVLAATFSLLAAIGAAVRDIVIEIPKNRFGLCSGSSYGTQKSGDVLPLTDWLHNFLQSLADRGLDQPLTFGDLWNTGGNETVEREIELEFMATNITRGVSHRLPFLEGNWGQLFFKESDLAQLFPRPVVDWMKWHAQAPRLTVAKIPEGYYGLPQPSDLPILFGARMSAGLPFLLSAIPLYAVHVTEADEVVLECCWFSDGGIASDLPLHFFDAPIPRRPTFAINFVPSSVDAVEVYEMNNVLRRGASFDSGKGVDGHTWDKVWMPQTNSDGLSWVVRFNEFRGVVGFAKAVLDTALNWSDTELMAMPGYRDRIVHVQLAPNEGGLNLNMPPEVISGLSTRGEFAGKLLAARFALEPGKDPKTGEQIELTWDNHRWIRYRSMMAALEVLTRRFRAAWHETGKPWRSYSELLRRDAGVEPQSYPLERPEQFDFAVCTTDQFLGLADSWISQDQAFDRGSRSTVGETPRPKPVLRLVPPGSNDARA
jgi:hypothetical protein